MTGDDQDEVIEFLTRGESYGRPGEMPERIDTHASIVFLIGGCVFKLKRAVRFSFLDYSSVTARERFCRSELELNRRTAPDLYLAVRAITRNSRGMLEWDGDGPPLDWVVEMRRFDQNELFDRLASEGRLTPEFLIELADEIAVFHAEAEIAAVYGGRQGIAEVIDDNHKNFVLACPPLDRPTVERLRSESEAALEKVGSLLDIRQAEGRVRRCHGDLHLRNICLFNGRPTLFDCIEFSDSIACIDVLYDLAFLLMDLEHRGLRRFGNIVFNRYFDRADEISGLAALPLLLSVRAAVRAKVTVAALEVRPQGEAEARAYLGLASSLLHPSPPCLIAIGGLSGTGKSTVAAGLAANFAPAPGARILRSDVLRKSLMKVSPETRLPSIAYTHDMNERVYGAMHERAAAALAAGYSVVVDATFMDAVARESVAAVARTAGVPFVGLWLTAPTPVLIRRIDARYGDASDADRTVLMQQLEVDTGIVTWLLIDAGGSAVESIAAAQRALDWIKI